MPLPSQTRRTSMGGGSMYRRKRRNLPPVLVGGVVIVAMAAGVYFLLPKGQRDRVIQPGSAVAQQPATKPNPSQPAPVQPTPLVHETPKAPIAEPKPAPILEIGQGASGERAKRVTAPESTVQSSKDNSTKPPAPATNPTPAPVATTPVAPPQPKAESGPIDSIASVAAARQKEQAGDLVAARALYSRVLNDGKLMPSEQQTIRDELTKINEDLVFSTRVAKDDPYADTYTVQSGDSFTKINQKLNLGPDLRLIGRINKTKPENLRLGQHLKVIKGPFHVVVHKSVYRLDLYMGPPDRQSDWLFIRSFTVGLGEGNSTPVGTFIVRKGSKLVNPPWVNPRTGERFDADDPKNPIGERWIGLEGIGESAAISGYGIHGTIDPESIGKQKSMGCVRLGSDDINLLFELLGESLSHVNIEAQ